MKLLEYKFVVVNVERWNDKRGGSGKKSDLVQFGGGGGGGDDNEFTGVGISDDKSS